LGSRKTAPKKKVLPKTTPREGKGPPGEIQGKRGKGHGGKKEGTCRSVYGRGKKTVSKRETLHQGLLAEIPG